MLVVSESRHREGPGEELYPLAELCNAGRGLCILQQEGLEAGQVPCWKDEEPRQQL